MGLYKITEQKLYYFRYSDNTIKSYLHYVSEFEDSIKKHHSRITSKDIQMYINSYKFTSCSQQNQIISALKFMWEKGLGKKYFKIDFRRPRKETKLPRVINHEELISKIKNISNLKHKAIITLAYSTGMRVSEVINLKLTDIDSKNMIIHIKNAKGQKDRIVTLSVNTLNILRLYYKAYKPNVHLFNGQSSVKYSRTSCGNIVKKYLGEDKHFHLIRHSAMTKMLDNGTDLRVIQGIAGHSSPNTTARYLHLSNNILQSVRMPI